MILLLQNQRKGPFLVAQGLGLSSVQPLSRVWPFVTPWTAARQASLPSPTPGATQTHVHWVSDAIQPSHPLSSPSPPTLQSFPASRTFPKSQFFTSGGWSTGVSASASVLPMNTQDWSPLGWTGWISLQSKGLSRVFSNTTVQKHQFFGAQLSSQSNSHIHTWFSFRKHHLCLSSPELASILTSMSSIMCLYTHLGIGMLSIDVIIYVHRRTHVQVYIPIYFNFIDMHTCWHICAAYFVCVSACVYF